ncbi:ACP S-malonyltransferase [Holospora curviuscula]|uniref:Malonyl CoA-acyl carrier protein transacylase n=1 Tax=Holospora curviuscula TaxID=1082868 RepID=A0A2S5R6Q8_9PROT|nr:ACP S-malonyltransferase [Holospora curviuscula]PPE03019.1 Polyketide biosynthesis malonyl CoA-acyl carrier protein transacylase PksC [Holospora curviuscula]
MIALLFPGQGAQCVGMGQTLAHRFPIIKARCEEADEFFAYTGQSLIQIMWHGPWETLMHTQWAQPALFALSAGLFDVVHQHCGLADLSIGWVAGHSLGEYSALYASGCFSFQEGLAHIQARCQAMAQVQDGAMAAILKLSLENIHELLQRYGEGQVELANDNCPGQVVISGKKDSVHRILTLAQAQGARCILLQVSGPFHSSFMNLAAERFSHYLKPVSFSSPSIPVITNVSAALQHDPESIKLQLIHHLTHPVRWRETLQTLHRLGAEYYLELGPGATLTGLVRKTLDSVSATSLGDLPVLEAWMHATMVPSARAMPNL